MAAGSKRAVRESARGRSKRQQLEIEVKLRIGDRKQILQRLAEVGAKLASGRVHESNTLYDTADGSLARQGRMLRVRTERPTERQAEACNAVNIGSAEIGWPALLTYKGPGRAVESGAQRAGLQRGIKASPYKVREEHELRISDAQEIRRILGGLGFRQWFRYEKFRTTYRLPGIKNLKLEVDETPIGVFLELEGPRREIDCAAERLGFSREEYINKSYGELFMERRGAGLKGWELPNGPATRKRKKGASESQNEPIPFSGMPDMLFLRSK
jgi:adenylate cyclase class 2